jgi:maltose alpha-D-glucosyltransferase/alpha-amylase
MPGVPFIYYGDEIGMHFLPEAPNKEGGLLDDLQRCGSRTPMQWSKEKNAGFSTAASAELYLPIDPSDARPDVATEETDPASMLNFTRALLKLRREHPALANNSGYLRITDSERIIVSVNPAGRPCTVALKDVTRVTPLLVQGAAFRQGRFEMDPVSFGIFALQNAD